jgi:hypothetical protein
MKTTYILGAGFSKGAGMPLSTELTTALLGRFPELKDVPKHAHIWYIPDLGTVDLVLQRLSRGKHLVNVEEVFEFLRHQASLWHMRHLLTKDGAKVDGTFGAHAISMRRFADDMLPKILWEIMCDCQAQILQKSLPDYLTRWCRSLNDGDSVITFNFDTLVETVLDASKREWTYGFDEGPIADLGLFKLHGSLDWLVAPYHETFSKECTELFLPAQVQSARATLEEQRQRKYKLIRRPLPKRRVTRGWDLPFGAGMAVLGPRKTLDDIPGIGACWTRAVNALHECDRVVIAGYSLPAFDCHARLLFTGVMNARRESKRKLPQIEVVDCRASKLSATYRRIFGRSIRVTNQLCENHEW